MEVMLALLTGVLVAAGAYLMMSGRTLPYIFGLTMISNAANILIFVAGRLTFGEPPLVPAGAETVERRGQRAAAGADPDRDRHRLRAPGLRAGARLPLLLRARDHRDGRDARGRARRGAARLVLLFLPLVVPFATAVLAMLAWRSTAMQRGDLARGRARAAGGRGRASSSRWRARGPFAAQAGGWPAPFGITMVADGLTRRHGAARRAGRGGGAGLRPRRRDGGGGAPRPPPADCTRCSPASAARS